jgi:hypothetical protein
VRGRGKVMQKMTPDRGVWQVEGVRQVMSSRVGGRVACMVRLLLLVGWEGMSWAAG